MSKPQAIKLKGVRQNNLKNLDLEIQTGKLTVITGPSGSGKSSLAFQTLYAEGQRRYVETFSPYVRQFFDRMDKPLVDKIEGIPPAIAIEQKNAIRTSRSTVGTLTELNDYLKLLYARLAKGIDPISGEEITPDSSHTIANWAFQNQADSPILILFPIASPSPEASIEDFFEFLNGQGYLRIMVEGAIYRTDEASSISDPNILHKYTIYVVQDRIKISQANRKRLIESLERALLLGKGCCALGGKTPDESYTVLKSFSDEWHNPDTGTTLTPPTPGLFSFNSPVGACPKCRGFGRVIGIDLQKAIPDRSLSISEGCIKPFQSDRGAESQQDLIQAAKAQGIDVNAPFEDLEPDIQDWVLYGEDPHLYEQDVDNEVAVPRSERLWLEGKWYGIQGFFDWLETKAYKMHVRVFLARYRSYTDCPSCRGQRLRNNALCYKINGHTLPDLWNLSLESLQLFFENLQSSVQEKSNEETLQLIYEQIVSRIEYLLQVGLGYLTLNRSARTLSGGEIARVNLTTCLGASLTGTLFVLDEPTVGLHPRDISNLITVIHRLRDKGNTLVIVEHEEALMRQADELIDIGPGAGHLGGTILYQGEVAHHISKKTTSPTDSSSTLDYLNGQASLTIPKHRRQPSHFISIKGLSKNNLQDLSIDIPLGILTCITGVSGSGKSTLVEKGLYQNLLKHFNPSKAEDAAPISEISGWKEHISNVAFIDQTPLAKTPRSTPAVYLGAFNEIRQLFALTSEAKVRGVNTGYFSFNSGTGRCERCMGNGFEKIEMQFLSDLYLKCPECDGRRFKKEALELTYQGLSIADILETTSDEALTFFNNLTDNAPKPIIRRHRSIIRTLEALREVGLGYLTLGQPLNTLSGGESQRLKIASLLLETTKPQKETALKQVSRTTDTTTLIKDKLDSLMSTSPCPPQGQLLILDEPTTGLHFGDIKVLLKAFDKLVEAGHSLIVVEHNMEVIKSSDYIIDLGPEAGTKGGTISGVGTPEDIAQLDTPTGTYLSKVLDSNPSLLAAESSGEYQTSAPPHTLSIRGANHHNLKSLDVDLPLNSFNVVTGLSGSGKSTLAFDLIFAEGQRRFLDSMSPYARQFAEQLEKPNVDSITGLPPTVAIEQRISRGGGKSTVATATEIYHFLRLLFAKLGVQHCPTSGDPVVSQTEASIFEQIKNEAKKGRIHLMAPVVRGRKGFHTDVADRATRLGYQALLVDRQIIEIDDFEPLERYVEHDIDIIVTAGTNLSPKLLKAKISEALEISKGFIRILDHTNHFKVYSTARVSAATGESFEAPDPADFSFNSPRGWCPDCRGYGVLLLKRLNLEKFDSALEAEIAEEKMRLNSDEEETICSSCNGSRLKRSSQFVLLGDDKLSLPALTEATVTQAKELVSGLKFLGREKTIARDIIPEIVQRLHFLDQVGLGYLSLNRSATTLSGGEAQRIRLASQLGSNLQGVMYVLDEPTIGLHPRDNAALLDTLEALQKRGNSLLIVEHDEETMARANCIIDLGPGAGRLGGEIVGQGSLKQLMRKKTSVTGQALRAPLKHPLKGHRRPTSTLSSKEWITIKGCHVNNLQNIDVKIPKGRLTIISGVSGSGKSSFMRGTLQPVANTLSKLKAEKKLTQTQKRSIAPYCKDANGFSDFKYVFEVDQSPIGKTSRSCPATYVKIFDNIRKVFAQLPEAQIRGFSAGRFSFNNAEGQCPDCKGNGSVKLEMDFLPSTRIPCETCRGDRYNPATLTVLYKGKTIADVLKMSIGEAAEFFSSHPKLSRTLKLLAETGLEYLQIGQPSQTLSGGEAQRLKLVTELTKGRVKENGTKALNKNIYLIEEPSIGLHLNDIRKLIDVLHRLTDEGHTVVVVEHHPALMAEADHILDFGPEAGPNGGIICAQGSPEEVAQSQDSTTAPFLRQTLNS